MTGRRHHRSLPFKRRRSRSVSAGLEGYSLVTYARTGTALVQGVVDGCLAGQRIQFVYSRLSLPMVHFVRDPKALIRSAYEYHKVGREFWLHDPSHTPHWIKADPVARSTYVIGETYQQYLNRVPFEVGFRAEFRRSSSELVQMIENAGTCAAFPAMCAQVCLEPFAKSSESYQQMWAAILDFVGLNHSYLECINVYDMHNPQYIGRHRAHVARPTQKEVAQAYEEFTKLDQELWNNTLAEAGETWGCEPAWLSHEANATLIARLHEQSVRADGYA